MTSQAYTVNARAPVVFGVVSAKNDSWHNQNINSARNCPVSPPITSGKNEQYHSLILKYLRQTEIPVDDYVYLPRVLNSQQGAGITIISGKITIIPGESTNLLQHLRMENKLSEYYKTYSLDIRGVDNKSITFKSIDLRYQDSLTGYAEDGCAYNLTFKAPKYESTSGIIGKAETINNIIVSVSPLPDFKKTNLTPDLTKLAEERLKKRFKEKYSLSGIKLLSNNCYQITAIKKTEKRKIKYRIFYLYKNELEHQLNKDNNNGLHRKPQATLHQAVGVNVSEKYKTGQPFTAKRIKNSAFNMHFFSQELSRLCVKLRSIARSHRQGDLQKCATKTISLLNPFEGVTSIPPSFIGRKNNEDGAANFFSTPYMEKLDKLFREHPGLKGPMSEGLLLHLIKELRHGESCTLSLVKRSMTFLGIVKTGLPFIGWFAGLAASHSGLKEIKMTKQSDRVDFVFSLKNGHSISAIAGTGQGLSDYTHLKYGDTTWLSFVPLEASASLTKNAHKRTEVSFSINTSVLEDFSHKNQRILFPEHVETSCEKRQATTLALELSSQLRVQDGAPLSEDLSRTFRLYGEVRAKAALSYETKNVKNNNESKNESSILAHFSLRRILGKMMLLIPGTENYVVPLAPSDTSLIDKTNEIYEKKTDLSGSTSLPNRFLNILTAISDDKLPDEIRKTYKSTKLMSTPIELNIKNKKNTKLLDYLEGNMHYGAMTRFNHAIAKINEYKRNSQGKISRTESDATYILCAKAVSLRNTLREKIGNFPKSVNKEQDEAEIKQLYSQLKDEKYIIKSISLKQRNQSYNVLKSFNLLLAKGESKTKIASECDIGHICFSYDSNQKILMNYQLGLIA